MGALGEGCALGPHELKGSQRAASQEPAHGAFDMNVIPATRACMVAVEGRAAHERQAEHALALAAAAAGAAGPLARGRPAALLLLKLVLLLPRAGGVESRFQRQRQLGEEPAGCRTEDPCRQP